MYCNVQYQSDCEGLLRRKKLSTLNGKFGLTLANDGAKRIDEPERRRETEDDLKMIEKAIPVADNIKGFLIFDVF